MFFIAFIPTKLVVSGLQIKGVVEIIALKMEFFHGALEGLHRVEQILSLMSSGCISHLLQADTCIPADKYLPSHSRYIEKVRPGSCKWCTN